MKTDPMIGRKFTRLTVMSLVRTDKGYNKRYLCKCSCGNHHIVIGNNLKQGHIKSCGCLRKEIVAIRSTTHGQTKHRKLSNTYQSWKTMKRRCLVETSSDYPRYGGRGITVCERWQKFENFLADMGKRPKGKTLDRIDNDRGYFPENCKWSTPKEQARNRKTNRLIQYKGKIKTLLEWAETAKLNYSTLQTRLKRGWSIEKSLTTPIRKYK